MQHYLKTLPVYFERVWIKEKNFQIRNNDRGFQAGDTIQLLEWSAEGGYTNRYIECTIKYVLHGFEGLANGYVGLAIEINNCIS